MYPIPGDWNWDRGIDMYYLLPSFIPPTLISFLIYIHMKMKSTNVPDMYVELDLAQLSYIRSTDRIAAIAKYPNYVVPIAYRHL